MKNINRIIKDSFPVPKSDLVEFIFCEDGAFNFGEKSFNHIKFNGKLITDKTIIKEKLGFITNYYIPKLEEFHVGFEYEEDDNNTGNWEFEVCGLDNTGDLEMIKDFILEGNIRVKHLDKKDIHDLGFRKKSLTYSERIVDVVGDKAHYINIINENLKNVYALSLNKEPHYGVDEKLCYIIHKPWKENKHRYEINTIQYFTDNSASIKTVFYGTIKNKSELKHILDIIEL
tara:strand:- start:5500 stop:6189 length:690 start_codon:yes stop_codon:yes gene_type:complete